MAQQQLPSTGNGATFVNTINNNATDVENYKTTVNNQLSTVITQGGTLNANLSAGSHKITNLATPTDSGDAVNKSYVDALPPSAPSWLPNTAYKTGQLVALSGGTWTNGQFKNALFMVVKNHTSGSTFPGSTANYLTTDGNYRLMTIGAFAKRYTWTWNNGLQMVADRVGDVVTIVSSGPFTSPVAVGNDWGVWSPEQMPQEIRPNEIYIAECGFSGETYAEPIKANINTNGQVRYRQVRYIGSETFNTGTYADMMATYTVISEAGTWQAFLPA